MYMYFQALIFSLHLFLSLLCASVTFRAVAVTCQHQQVSLMASMLILMAAGYTVKGKYSPTCPEHSQQIEFGFIRLRTCPLNMYRHSKVHI